MFGLYVHIPYCLQRCSYCDFATYVYDQILPPEEYVKLVIKELRQKASLLPGQPLTSIYFGGGTPSLLSSELILSILDEIGKTKLLISSETEITLEINPATLDVQKIRHLLSGGVNRFSVGAQTFNDDLLKAAGRKHSSADTLKTLDLLQSEGVNYSFDLLFALPKQTLEDLHQDLKKIIELKPPHLSAYCLTVPTGHPMSFNRATEDHQVEMFNAISQALSTIGLERYEISNFSVPGKESQHNLLYWRDGEYLGLGLSAHSYLKNQHPWGCRFWNPSSIQEYTHLISEESSTLPVLLDKKCGEVLDEKSSIFDFCHTALRLDAGLNKTQLKNKYSVELVAQMEKRLNKLLTRGLLKSDESTWRLSPDGVLISNYVFSEIAL